MFKNHRKKIIAAIILIIAALGTWMIRNNRDVVFAVDAGDVVRSSFQRTVLAAGKLEVREKQEVYTEREQKIKDLPVKVGDVVSKGQLVMQMEDNDLAMEVSKNRVAYEEIQAKLVTSESNIRQYQEACSLAQKKYDNVKVLFNAGAVTREEFGNAEKTLAEEKEKLLVERNANLPFLKSQLVQTGAVLRDSEDRLREATVTSALNGVILNLPVKKGQKVDPGTLLAEIGDPGLLEVETGVNELDAAELKVGNRVEIAGNIWDEETIAGRLEYIAPIAETIETSQGKQTHVKVRVAIDNRGAATKLKPGYNVNLKIILNQKDKAVLVPYEAVAKNGKKNIVFVIGKDAVVSERVIKTGQSNDLYYEVISGLNAGEKVVLNPGRQIKNGVKVKINAASE